MIFYMMIQLLSGVQVTAILPQLTLLALVAMRLIPCANRINNHLTSISYFEPFFMGVSDNLQEEIRVKVLIITQPPIRKRWRYRSLRSDIISS